MNGSLILFHILLEIINPKAKVSRRDLKDKLQDVKITYFKDDIPELLTYM